MSRVRAISSIVASFQVAGGAAIVLIVLGRS